MEEKSSETVRLLRRRSIEKEDFRRRKSSTRKAQRLISFICEIGSAVGRHSENGGSIYPPKALGHLGKDQVLRRDREH